MATKNINASWQFTKDAITVAEGYSVLTQATGRHLTCLIHGMVRMDRWWK